MEKLEQCPACHSNDIQSKFECKDHFLSQELFEVFSCAKCDLLFTNPRPDPQEIGKYYASENYISHTDKGNSIINQIYKLARTFTIRQKSKMLTSLTNNKSILDIGCGTGELISHLQKEGWEVCGVEPDDNARKIALSKIDSGVMADISDLPDTKYAIITLWHVLEHVHNLHKYFQLFVNQLDTNGKLVIAVPNHESYDADHYKNSWAAYDVPRHLYHFNQNAIKSLASQYGFTLKNVNPMYLDSYYVSMLSEKYTNGKNNFLKAFYTGLRSNFKASKNKNYSSLIYIFSNEDN